MIHLIQLLPLKDKYAIHSVMPVKRGKMEQQTILSELYGAVPFSSHLDLLNAVYLIQFQKNVAYCYFIEVLQKKEALLSHYPIVHLRPFSHGFSPDY